MRIKFLQIKRALSAALFVLLLNVAGMTKAFAQQYESYWPDFNYQDYDSQAGFVAAIMIDGQIIYNTTEGWDALEVASFVGDECRGNNNYLYDGYVQEYGDPFPVLDGMPIYYTSLSDTVTFKMYDHMNGILYEDCEVIYNGEPITVLTGEYHEEGWFDPENPVFLSFTTSTQGTHWPEFSNHFSNQAGIVAAIMIDGQIVNITTEGWDALEVAAFVGDECRANEMYLFDGYVQDYGDPFPVLDGLSIYYDTPNEVVSFKMFNHLNEIEYDSCTILYNGEPITILTGENHFEGWDDPENPIMLSFTTPELNSYEISVTANPDEGGTVNGSGTYYHGQYCTLTALANEGFTFHYWTENGEVVSSDVEYTFLVKRDRNLVADFSSNSPIVFADANVKALCVANWDTDGDGELSYAEASEVTNLGEVFRNKYSIGYFDELQYFTGLTSIDNYAFYYCNNLTSIALPSSVTSIGYYAFYNCSSLTSIELPSSVTSIGYYAFSYCYSLTSIELPSSLTSIGDRAWDYCNSLTSIELPSSVNYLGTNPFAGCYNMEQITVDSDNPYFDSRENCNAIINTSTNALVTGCKNTVIPSSVTSIGNYAFYNCYNLTSIELPDSITSIGNNAFSNCYNLTSIELPSSVTSIGNYAFYYCYNLTSIELPSSVTSIGNYAFYYCYNLTSIELSSSLTSLGSYAFYYCYNLTSIELPSSLTSIGNSAFYNCYNLTSIELPSSLASIGNRAFSYCTGLASITSFAETPPYLYYDAFYAVPTNIPVYVPCDTEENYQASNGWSNFSNITGMCSGEVTVTVNPSEGGTVTGAGYYSGGEVCVLTATPNQGFAFSNWTENGRVISMDSVYTFYAHPTTIVATFSSNSPIVFADANVKAICVANWDTDGDGELSYAEAALVTDLGDVFMYNGSISSFNELQCFISLTSIGYEAFFDCYNLTSITLPSSLTSIGNYAFYYCNNLTSIELPSFVTSIGYDAFYYCYNLTSIALPSSVNYLGTNAFAGCSGLEQITVDSDNPYFDSRENCNAIINTSTNALVTGCKNTVIPSSVTSIGDYAFYNCYDLTSIELPDSITSIGYGAFSYCSGLTSIELPDSLTSIDGEVFYYCYNLTSIELPSSITSIGYRAFSYCSGLTSIELPDSLTSIEGEVFYYCYNLTSIELPSSLTSIGDWAFGDCTGLASITSFAETPPYSYDYSFENVSTNIPIYVPCGVSEDYQYASGWSIFANFYEMCPSNHWTAESYQNSMFMIGKVMIDGVEQVSPILELGAFCNDECRGSALPVLDGGQWLYFMTIDGNSGDDITFRLYDHAIQQELNYYCFNVIPFEVYGLIGIDEPYEVQFASTLSVSVDVNPENAGTVEGTGEYAIGEYVTLTATANEGYLFNSWTLDGEIVSTEPSYSFTVTEPVSLTANFDILYSVSVDVNMEEAGVVTGEGEYLSGTEVTLTATANEGYIFKNWTLDGEIVSTEPSYTFTVTESVNLTANFHVVRTQQLIAGWNWWSSSLEITLNDLKTALVEALPGTTITIKSQTNNTTYNPNNHRWVGSVTWDLSKMYMIKVDAACEVTLHGYPIDPAQHPASIINGVNWISFPLSQSMLVNDALVGFPAVEHDIIKSQTNNTIFIRDLWRGALTTFELGKGYMFISNSQDSRILTFPTNAK